MTFCDDRKVPTASASSRKVCFLTWLISTPAGRAPGAAGPASVLGFCNHQAKVEATAIPATATTEYILLEAMNEILFSCS